MRLVLIESPLAGDVEANVAYARRAMRSCLEQGEAPIASHLLYTQALDDTVPEDRALGMEAGWAWLPVVDAVVVFEDRGISGGMKAGIERALAAGKIVEYRSIDA